MSTSATVTITAYPPNIQKGELVHAEGRVIGIALSDSDSDGRVRVLLSNYAEAFRPDGTSGPSEFTMIPWEESKPKAKVIRKAIKFKRKSQTIHIDSLEGVREQLRRKTNE